MKARGGSAALAAMLRQRTETAAPPEVVQKSRRQSITETENTAAAAAVPAAPKPPAPAPVAPAPAAAPAPPKPAAPVRPPAPAIIPPAPKDASLPRTTSFSAAATPKCCLCEKSVYKVEEVQALGRVWHDKCFRCGGRQPVGENPGCGKVLRRDGYLDHHNEPFCTACYNKLYRPKGFGFSNTLSTDYGPVAGAENGSNKSDSGAASAPTAAAAAVSAESAASITAAAAAAAPAPAPAPAPPAPPAPVAAPVAAAVPVSAPVVSAPAVDVPAAASAPTKPAPPAWLRKTPSQSQAQPPAQPAPPAAAAPAAPVAAPAVPAASITIGASSRAPKASSLHVEARYVGDNDEVDESEWD